MKAIAVDCPNPRCAGGTLKTKKRTFLIDCGTTRLSRALFHNKTIDIVFSGSLGMALGMITFGFITNIVPIIYSGIGLLIANIFLRIVFLLVSRIKIVTHVIFFYECKSCHYTWTGNEDTSERLGLKRLKGMENDLIWYRKIDNKSELRRALIILATFCLAYKDDYHRAQQLLEESVAIGAARGIRGGYNSYVTINLGQITMLKNYTSAQESFEKAIFASQQRKDYDGYMIALCYAGYAHLYQGALPQAISAFKESLEAFYLSGQRHNTELSLDGLAGVAVRQNQPVRAARLFGAAEARREKSQNMMAPLRRPQYEHLVEEARTQLDPAVFAAMWAEGRALILEDAITYALEENAPVALG